MSQSLATPADMPPLRRLPQRTGLSGGTVSSSFHQTQYSDRIANFFHIFNRRTGRDTFFWGYMEGHFANNQTMLHEDSIAVDFGCGTGWLTSHLARNFAQVYGIDTSEAMLKIALATVPNEADRIGFHQEAPAHIAEKSDFVSAVHVHYHFESKEKLQNEFFQAAADLLLPKGEFLLIGCPSDHIRNSPAHYKNHVNVNTLPDEIVNRASQISLLTDADGFVALDAVPKFQLKDGTQMRVKFKTTDDKGKPIDITLTDTFWSDEALISAAKQAGLVLEKRANLTWRDHPNAYMAMHFRKLPAAHPAHG